MCTSDLVVVATARDTEGAACVPVGLGSHAINHAADSATAKDHRVRTFEHLHPLDIVEIAELLGVVADAVDEEIGRRAVAPEDRRVAIAFALREGAAWPIAAAKTGRASGRERVCRYRGVA